MGIINKNFNKKIFFLGILILIALLGYFFIFSDHDKQSFIKIAGQNIKVELATTVKEQEQGLSGRKNLAEGTGMLFIFDKSARYSFWMKDMNFSIDMIWFNSDFQVVYIKKNAQPESYPDIFTPELEAKYVLEVPAGFSEKNNLEVGNMVQFLSQKSF